MQPPIIEVPPPDIRRHRQSNVGIPYCHELNSGVPGPYVVLCALTHGNEYCGAVVLSELLDSGFCPKRGTVAVCFMNVAAFERFDLANPYASRCVDEDMNRLWVDEELDAGPYTLERTRAIQVRPIIQRATHLLDIHSIDALHPPVMLCGMQDKSLWLSQRVGSPAIMVQDAGHADGCRLRDYSYFNDPADARTALLAECGQHWLKDSVDVAQECVWRFLRAVGSIDEVDWGGMPPRASAGAVVRISHVVTAKTSEVKFQSGITGLKVIPHEGDIVGFDGIDPIRVPYDNAVLLMPRLQEAHPGQTVLRIGQIVKVGHTN